MTLDTPQAGAASGQPRVAVVFGGRSTEHAISCLTAGGVMTALTAAGYDVCAIGITRDGRWVLPPADPALLTVKDGRLPEVDASHPPVVVVPDPAEPGLFVRDASGRLRSLGRIDVAFPVLHGPFGEDGTIQGLFEMAGIPYVGSGVFASAAAMDKQFMKVLFVGAGLPDVPHVVVTPDEWRTDPAAVRESVASLGFPVFVKPARGGSSVAVTKVHKPADVDEAIERAREVDPKVLVERAIDGREIEVGVLDDVHGGAPKVSVPAEILVRGREFYDFEAKYLDQGTVITIPASLPPAVLQTVNRYAVIAYRALGCEGLARVDFFVTATGEVFVNELNTMPGFTPTSVFPRVWQASGLEYPELVDYLVQLALRRRPGLR
ncbi:MAG: D-alanine--D-alanine ligase [Acidothermus cellulolyticus]|nr:D-alanine--D-alanine ligase [Acidothermus cellulolyticus]